MSDLDRSVNINGTTYIREDLSKPAANNDGNPFVIVRSYGAGVFAGYLKKKDTKNREVVLDGSIRMHAWTGCSLSQVSRDGIAGNGENRFAMPVDDHTIAQYIEILPCTEKARLAIEGEKTWKF